MKKSKLLTSIVALALVLGLGACEETEIEDTFEGNEEETTSQSSESNTDEAGDDNTPEEPVAYALVGSFDDASWDAKPAEDSKYYIPLGTPEYKVTVTMDDEPNYGEYDPWAAGLRVVEWGDSWNLVAGYSELDEASTGILEYEKEDNIAVKWGATYDIVLTLGETNLILVTLEEEEEEDIYDSYPAIYKNDERYHIYEDGTIEVHQVVAQGEEDSGKGSCEVCGASDLVTSYVSYSLNSDGVSYYVSKYDVGVWSTIEEVYVKKEYNGLPVTGISYEGASDHTGFSTSGGQANALKFIGLPKTITCIGDYAFKDCTSLEVLDIPDGVTYIGKSGFRNCQSLEGPISIPEGQDTIYSYTFEHCHALKDVIIPSSVTTLNGDCIFEYCYALTSVILPDSITTLSGSGTDQFAGCTSLEFFKFSANLEKTTNRFVSSCESLKTIVIPSGSISFNSGTFTNDTALTTVYFGGTEEEWTTVSSGVTILQDLTPTYFTYSE